MTRFTEALGYLIMPRASWVDVEVHVVRIDQNSISVTSKHTYKDGTPLQKFSISWPDDIAFNTEYGWGLSVVHDVKDHYFYGLGITTLTEFQTIVQTYYGREGSGGRQGRAEDGDFIRRIKQAIKDELFGPRGPRVYGPLETGLFDLHVPQLSLSDRQLAHDWMTYICLEIMLPRLREVYDSNPLIRSLQASTRDQLELIDTLLPAVKWTNRDALLFQIRDNIGLRIYARAYVHEKLMSVTLDIRNAIREYADAYPLMRSFGPIFDTANYCVSDVNQYTLK
jgi:hypothetical protein